MSDQTCGYDAVWNRTGREPKSVLYWFLTNTVTFESVLRQERSRLNLYFPPKSWVVVGTKRLIRATYSPGLGLKFEALLSCKIGFSGMLLWGERLLGWSGPQGRDDRLLSPETWENEQQVASRNHWLPGAKLPFLLGDSAKGHHHVSKEGKGRTYWGRILNPTTLAVSRIWTLCVGRWERPNVPGSSLVKGKEGVGVPERLTPRWQRPQHNRNCGSCALSTSLESKPSLAPPLDSAP